jgi:pimeloyl-ACP methyl ester carboxylesterase
MFGPHRPIRGAASHASDPERDGRASAFRNRHVVTIANAGHWVHHDQLEAFLRVVEPFLKDEPPGA